MASEPPKKPASPTHGDGSAPAVFSHSNGKLRFTLRKPVASTSPTSSSPPDALESPPTIVHTTSPSTLTTSDQTQPTKTQLDFINTPFDPSTLVPTQLPTSFSLVAPQRPSDPETTFPQLAEIIFPKAGLGTTDSVLHTIHTIPVVFRWLVPLNMKLLDAQQDSKSGNVFRFSAPNGAVQCPCKFEVRVGTQRIEGDGQKELVEPGFQKQGALTSQVFSNNYISVPIKVNHINTRDMAPVQIVCTASNEQGAPYEVKSPPIIIKNGKNTYKVDKYKEYFRDEPVYPYAAVAKTYFDYCSQYGLGSKSKSQEKGKNPSSASPNSFSPSGSDQAMEEAQQDVDEDDIDGITISATKSEMAPAPATIHVPEAMHPAKKARVNKRDVRLVFEPDSGPGMSPIPVQRPPDAANGQIIDRLFEGTVATPAHKNVIFNGGITGMTDLGYLVEFVINGRRYKGYMLAETTPTTPTTPNTTARPPPELHHQYHTPNGNSNNNNHNYAIPFSHPNTTPPLSGHKIPSVVRPPSLATPASRQKVADQVVTDLMEQFNNKKQNLGFQTNTRPILTPEEYTQFTGWLKTQDIPAKPKSP